MRRGQKPRRSSHRRGSKPGIVHQNAVPASSCRPLARSNLARDRKLLPRCVDPTDAKQRQPGVTRHTASLNIVARFAHSTAPVLARPGVFLSASICFYAWSVERGMVDAVRLFWYVTFVLFGPARPFSQLLNGRLAQ